MTSATLPYWGLPKGLLSSNALSSLQPSAAGSLFEVLSLLCVFSLLTLCCLPPLHLPLRTWLRPIVVFHVERGFQWVVWAQAHQNPLLTALFTWSSHTVSVAFYVTFLPALFWVGEPQLGHRLVVLMFLCLYVGNALKDLISAPRPLSVKSGKKRAILLAQSGHDLEAHASSQEYGLPSSHTLDSLALNFYILHYYVGKGVVPESNQLPLYICAGLWVTWIGMARIYMGLHTPVDIFAGAAAGTALLLSYMRLDDAYEEWILNTDWPAVLLWQALFSMIFLRLHPKPLNYTPSYEFTVSFVGVGFGVVTGVARTYSKNAVVDSLFPILLSQQGLVIMARRMFLGFFLVALLKEVTKAFLLKTLPALYDVVPLSLRRKWQPPMHSLSKTEFCPGIPVNEDGRAWDVEVTARFFSYAAIGWTVVELSPLMFETLGW